MNKGTYNSRNVPTIDPLEEHNIRVGRHIAFSDTDDNPTHFHIGEVVEIRDDNIVVANLATIGPKMATAKWKMLYEDKGTLTIFPPNAKTAPTVEDEIPLEAADDYIHHYHVKLNTSGTISAATRRHLTKTGLKHHVLGKTY